jgi:crossover junction endodeoxyribonuclease RuvC
MRWSGLALSPSLRFPTMNAKAQNRSLIRIIGVDPGLACTGFGVIETTLNGTARYIGSGTIHSPQGQSLAKRLQKIYHGLLREMERYSPQFMGVEKPFLARNVKSAMLLGQARGLAILAAAEAEVPVQEFSPLEIKQAVVGYGRAGKAQVEAMIRSILQIPDPLSPHAADALAVAVCFGHVLPWQISLAAISGSGFQPSKARVDSSPTEILEGHQ